jgi:hypothetical protein
MFFTQNVLDNASRAEETLRTLATNIRHGGNQSLEYVAGRETAHAGTETPLTSQSMARSDHEGLERAIVVMPEGANALLNVV